VIQKTAECEQVDVLVENHGTIFMFRVLTDTAQEWVDKHVQTEDYQWTDNGFAVEHRYAEPLAVGMLEAGLVVV
jgi:hypothetical protein